VPATERAADTAVDTVGREKFWGPAVPASALALALFPEVKLV
jgi:hypothetical protein